jgi:hypothetical protein
MTSEAPVLGPLRDTPPSTGRPPKHVYDVKHLGPRYLPTATPTPLLSSRRPTRPSRPTRRLAVKGVVAVREDYTLQNPRGHVLHVSHWSPDKLRNKPHPCVVWLHGETPSPAVGL